MIWKDFENFELKLKKLREESLEQFQHAEHIYSSKYEKQVENIFRRDVLWIKSKLKGYFILRLCDSWDLTSESGEDIFQDITKILIGELPLSREKQERLSTLLHQKISSHRVELWEEKLEKNISREPFFVLVEEFSMDGDISPEEFQILQQSYKESGDFIAAIESLPQATQQLFKEHLSLLLAQNKNEKQSSFELEYAPELKKLSGKWFNIRPVITFVARFYYKNPGKLRKHEHPKRRLRRSFKLALLRLLRIKLGNIDAEKILERFENGESFEDYFFLIYQLMEVIDENPDGEEIFQLIDKEDEAESLVVEAEENTKKILAWESLIMKIAALFGKTEAHLEEGVLEKILDKDTHFIGDEIHFAHNWENVGIYAQSQEDIDTEEDEEENDEEFDIHSSSPQTAYEILKHQFTKLEEEKKEAFKQGNYEHIDILNERLLVIQSKLEKLSKILES